MRTVENLSTVGNLLLRIKQKNDLLRPIIVIVYMMPSVHQPL